MNRSVSVIQALRERLKSAGYHLHSGRQLDPKTDQIPCVIIGLGEGGIQTVSEKPALKKSISVFVNYIFKTRTDDPLAELLIETDALNKILYRPERSKGLVDQLEGTAFSLTVQKSTLNTDSDHTDLGLIQTILNIQYVEK